MVAVRILPAGKPSGLTSDFPLTVEFHEDDTTVGDLKRRIAAKDPNVRRPVLLGLLSIHLTCLKFHPSRQRLTHVGDRKPLSNETTLEEAGIVDGAELNIKDLGPQISWRTVFIVEYVSLI